MACRARLERDAAGSKSGPGEQLGLEGRGRSGRTVLNVPRHGAGCGSSTIRTRGREAHSAYAHLGRSAIEPMLELLPTLRKLPLPSDPVLGETTVNIGTIKGGTEANVIPAHAESEIMFRLVGDVEPIKKMVLDWAKGHADVEFGSHIPAQRFATVPGFETGPVAYTSDIPLLSNWGEPLLFGPGSIHVAHTPDEYIDVEDLRRSVDTYERLAKTL